METLSVFNSKFHEIIKSNVKSILESSESEHDLAKTEVLPNLPENTLTCSYCKVQFENSNAQRDHYKLDWHRYNLKQSLLNRDFISEDKFIEKSTNDDLSSISGSDSEKEDSVDTFATAQGKIFLQNDLGKVFSIHKCLMFEKKEELSSSVLQNRLRECCVKSNQWTILMLGGGHFAGGVFQGDKSVLHKTFHCYTVRQGQGGSQSSKDSKTGHHAKSAGASLRRYNEQTLVQHVKSIIESWKNEIDGSSLIVYRASGPYNRSILFGGNTPLIDKSDSRLRTIPFSTRRATFTELKKVHSVLSSAKIYESYDHALEIIEKHKNSLKDSKRNRIKSAQINRAKSRETVERAIPTTRTQTSESEELSPGEVETVEQEISLSGLEEFTVDPETAERAKAWRKKKKPKKSKAKKLQELNDARKEELNRILYTGNVIKLKELLENIGQDVETDIPLDIDELKHTFVNEVVDDKGNSFLHIAAMNQHPELVRFLLENNADPCSKNCDQQTPYSCTQNKEIREVMKAFSKEYPDKYNYNKAQIPVNMLTEEELAQKKKAQRKIKKEKEKVKKKEAEIKRQDEEEQRRFLNLSDREKRALAAERRILSQSGTVISRCFLCAIDISGKVPFEYMGNRFCSIDCLKAHRLQHPTALK